MRYEEVTFPNQEGLNLSAIIEFPVTGKPAAYAVFAHCFTCVKNEQTASLISHQLAMANIAVLRFDYTGLGQSEGDFSESNLSTNIHDIQSAASFLEKNYVKPEVIIGHSLGGAAAILALEEVKSIRAIITIGAPSDPAHIRKLIKENSGENSEKGEASIDIDGRPFTIKQQFIDNLSKHNLKDILKKSRKALLILHAPQDKVVAISDAAELFESAFHPKSFVTLDRSDHMLTNNDDATYAGKVISSWLVRYLNLTDKPRLDTDKQAVVRTGKQKYYTEIVTGNHSMVADEPLHVHGQDLGPSPYDLLISALGACTSMTLRMYADHKGLDVEDIRVHLQHTKEHVEDSQDEKGGKIDKITREIEIMGNITHEQKLRMVEIANRCPVHKTLHGKIVVPTSLMDTK